VKKGASNCCFKAATKRTRRVISPAPFLLTWLFLIGLVWGAIPAEAVAAGQDSAGEDSTAESSQNAVPTRTVYKSSDYGIANAPEDPANKLEEPEQRRKQRDSLVDYTLFDSGRASFQEFTQSLYEKTSIQLGINSNNLYQYVDDVAPGTDKDGVSSDLDVIARWELTNKGTATMGQIITHVEGRWDYGTTPPSDIGDQNLRSLIRTADPFNSYTPTFLIRNMYWQQGSQSAGWTYRLGKITSDQTLGTSFHLNPFTTFLPSGSVGSNAAHPDSGLGAVGIKYFDDARWYALGLIGDANGDREDAGDIGEGDFFKALEFGYKIFPQTDRAGYSKLTIGHTDGTADGRPNNVALGPSGWSVAGKYEQELSADGRMIGILKYGRTYNDSGIFEEMASGHFLLYDPDLPGVRKIKNDVMGVGLVWAEAPIPGTRDETNLEVFYRLPVFRQLDVSFSYQSFWNVARNPDIDQANVYSVRLRTTF
jgi:porin